MERTAVRHSASTRLVTLGAAAMVLAGVACQSKGPQSPAQAAATPPPNSEPAKTNHGDDAGSKAAFLAAYPVFMHPRCMNCHPAGDAPLQGEDSHVHTQNVKRGPYGTGLYALKCSNCHQRANVPGPNMPPGNPTWQLPPESMKMVFQGRTPAQLAAQLKDPDQNGHKSLDQIVKHVTEDGLVAGCWNPGEGRAAPPLPHDEFARLVREWVEKGAICPD